MANKNIIDDEFYMKNDAFRAGYNYGYREGIDDTSIFFTKKWLLYVFAVIGMALIGGNTLSFFAKFLVKFYKAYIS